ncbi:MAG: hypothetical protein HUU28_08345 [Planctomycetaceae bacterium]|nr:hypothetical protein [Planctomycetaceae bacterium]
MADILSKENWLKLTNAGAMKTRSSALKRVDQALGEHERAPTPANLEALRSALMAWIQTKGANWRTDARNRFAAVDTLYRQVMDVPNLAPTAKERIALSHLRNESRAIVTDLFCNRPLEWRPGYLESLALKKRQEKVTLAYTVASTAKDVNTLVKAAGGRGAPSPESAIEGMTKALLPDDIAKEASAFLFSNSRGAMMAFAAEVTPFLGVFTSGGMAIYNGILTVRASHRISKADDHVQNSLSTAEPRHAIHAMIRVLERERNAAAAKFGIDSAAFGSKLAGLLMGEGVVTNAAVGVASTAAKLSVFLHSFARDYRERKAVNLMMKSGGILDGAKLFDLSPVTGAYMVCCVPTSVMVNSVFQRFYEQGWRGDVEYAVLKHIQPLREQSARVIREHRFWIPALQNFPGVLQLNKKKLKQMSNSVGKSGMEGIDRKDFWDWDA